MNPEPEIRDWDGGWKLHICPKCDCDCSFDIKWVEMEKGHPGWMRVQCDCGWGYLMWPADAKQGPVIRPEGNQ